MPPLVGVVIVRDDSVLGESYRGETGTGRHAEFGLVERLEGQLEGATVYTTLEPCSRRSEPKTPCAEHLINGRVSEVFIGTYDPNPKIYRQGWRMLRDAGIRLRDFPPDLRAQIEKDNAAFIDQFRGSIGRGGSATFDFEQNGGRFELRDGQEPLVVSTRWTGRGPGSIYALDYDEHVALARFAQNFDEIDDPGALDFSNYTVGVNEGEIVVFRTGSTYALVKVVSVVSGSDWDQDRTEIQIQYELRRP